MSSSAERFIEELAKREALPESIIKRLWDKVANSSSIPSAQALAQFLVDKGHLSRDDADAALTASKPKPKARKKKSSDAKAKAKSSSRRSSSSADDGDVLEATIVEAGADPDSAGAKGERGKKSKSGKRRYKKKTKGENEFDTPLMLLGGGGLVILLLVGGFIGWLLFSEGGDELLANARTAFEAGSYTQAVQDYERFVEKFEGHEGYSTARVTLAVARIRQITETNSEARLKKAQQEIPAVDDEPEFASIHEDLASLLPGISKGLSEKADAAEGLDEINKYVGLTRESLTLYDNTKYLPSRYRDEQERNEIEEVLARIDLRRAALEDLAATIDQMKKAVDAGDTRTAYAAHAQFAKTHPEKAADEELQKMVAATSKAEQAGIRYVEDLKPAKKTEPATAVAAAVTAADRRRTDEAPTAGVTVVRFQGGAYALDRRDGRLRWRRSLGAAMQQIEPVMIRDDCLLVDSSRNELVRIKSDTGELVWRTPLDDAVVQPTLVGDRVLAAGKSGKLHVIDAGSGNRVGYVQFAQALRSPPAVYAEGDRIFLVGDHSSVYTLDAKSLECLGVFYLGHAPGTVVSPPVVVLNRVVVVENDGATTSSLHPLGLDEKNIVAKQLPVGDEGESRLAGLVTRPPEVFGKRFAVTTESGNIGVYEATAGDDERPLTLLATRENRRRSRNTPYTAVNGQQLWVAGAGLARYSIQPSGKRLPARDIEEDFRGDTFVHPLSVNDGVVIHVRRRRGRAGATVSASDAKTGAVYWETDIAAPAAGPPVSVNGRGDLLYTTAGGSVFLIDEQAVKSGVADKVVRTGDGGAAPLDASAAGANSAVYAASRSGRALGINSAGGRPSIEPIRLPGALGGSPSPFGNGWLANLAVGQIIYFDGQSGNPLAAPFQPELAPRQRLEWHAPAIGQAEGKPVAVVAEAGANLYTLEVLQKPAPHLAVRASLSLEEERFVSRVAVSGEVAVVATSGDQLLSVTVDTLEKVAATPLEAEVVWGPFAVGDQVLIATADDRLVAIDPANGGPVWSQSVESTGLTGQPLLAQDVVTLPLASGVLQRRNLASGEVIDSVRLGQGIAATPTAQGDRLLASALDGTLLFIDPAVGL